MILESVGCIGGGAVLCQLDGCPISVPASRFKDAKDATDFLVWLGDVSDVRQIREDARRWSAVRDWLTCPSCPIGRVAPGNAQCQCCIDDAEFEREAAGQ